MMRFGCPKCSNVFTAPESDTGKRVTCAQCEQLVIVPPPKGSTALLGIALPGAHPSGAGPMAETPAIYAMVPDIPSVSSAQAHLRATPESTANFPASLTVAPPIPSPRPITPIVLDETTGPNYEYPYAPPRRSLMPFLVVAMILIPLTAAGAYVVYWTRLQEKKAVAVKPTAPASSKAEARGTRNGSTIGKVEEDDEEAARREDKKRAIEDLERTLKPSQPRVVPGSKLPVEEEAPKAPKKAGPVLDPNDTRRRWDKEGGGSFQFKGDGLWAESDDEGITLARWREARRTEEYIEIHQEARDYRLRLYAKKSELSAAKSAWAEFTPGQWK